MEDLAVLNGTELEGVKIGDEITFVDWNEIDEVTIKVTGFVDSPAHGPAVEGRIPGKDYQNIGPTRTLPLSRIKQVTFVSSKQTCQKCGNMAPAGTRMSKGFCKPCRDSEPVEVAESLQRMDEEVQQLVLEAGQPVEAPQAAKVEAPKVSGSTETLHCETCDQDFTRTRTRGRKPRVCPKCMVSEDRPKVAKADKVVKVAKQLCTKCNKESPVGSRVRNGLCKPCRGTEDASPRRTAPVQEKSPQKVSGELETLQCQECLKSFKRPRTRGRKPRFCPECSES